MPNFAFAHVELNVSRLKRSVAFYDRLFSYMGHRSRFRFKNGVGWSNGRSTFFIFQTESKFLKRKFHRKTAGINHVAFHASDRKAVGAFVKRFLIPNKIPMLYGGPKDWAEYRGGYYAVYFEDPDRIKLEYCHIPADRDRRRKR